VWGLNTHPSSTSPGQSKPQGGALLIGVAEIIHLGLCSSACTSIHRVIVTPTGPMVLYFTLWQPKVEPACEKEVVATARWPLPTSCCRPSDYCKPLSGSDCYTILKRSQVAPHLRRFGGGWRSEDQILPRWEREIAVGRGRKECWGRERSEGWKVRH
jgi:hypothetical protein